MMTSTTDLIRLLDILAEDFAESTRAESKRTRTTVGIVVRPGGKGSSARIATLDKLNQLHQRGELDRMGEITRLQILLGGRNEEGIVWTHDENRRAALNSLVEAGGEPLGMISLAYDGVKLRVNSAPFNEFIDDPSAQIDLRRICRKDPQLLLDCVSDREVKNVRYFDKPSATGPAMCQ